MLFVAAKVSHLGLLPQGQPERYRRVKAMEAAGLTIEIENIAKLYNRNFLLNDGRPGGLLVVRGEIDDDDKNELRSRFRGNLGKAGATTVISADDGVDQFVRYVNLGAASKGITLTDGELEAIRNLAASTLKMFLIRRKTEINLAVRQFNSMRFD